MRKQGPKWVSMYLWAMTAFESGAILFPNQERKQFIGTLLRYCCWNGHSRSRQFRGRDCRKTEVLETKGHNVLIVEVSGRISRIPSFLHKKVKKLYLASLK